MAAEEIAVPSFERRNPARLPVTADLGSNRIVLQCLAIKLTAWLSRFRG
jgi:hypothetical protein